MELNKAKFTLFSLIKRFNKFKLDIDQLVNELQDTKNLVTYLCSNDLANSMLATQESLDRLLLSIERDLEKIKEGE